eukprot:m51a1_g5638 hypothetical protein (355) ;mRNA; f:836957-838135
MAEQPPSDQQQPRERPKAMCIEVELERPSAVSPAASALRARLEGRPMTPRKSVDQIQQDLAEAEARRAQKLEEIKKKAAEDISKADTVKESARGPAPARPQTAAGRPIVPPLPGKAPDEVPISARGVPFERLIEEQMRAEAEGKGIGTAAAAAPPQTAPAKVAGTAAAAGAKAPVKRVAGDLGVAEGRLGTARREAHVCEQDGCCGGVTARLGHRSCGVASRGSHCGSSSVGCAHSHLLCCRQACGRGRGSCGTRKRSRNACSIREASLWRPSRSCSCGLACIQDRRYERCEARVHNCRGGVSSCERHSADRSCSHGGCEANFRVSHRGCGVAHEGSVLCLGQGCSSWSGRGQA